MNHAELLPRRLSLVGCKIVGTRLRTALDELKAKNISLAAKSAARAAEVLERTAAFDALASDEISMVALDNATDRAVAAFDNLLEATESSYDHGNLLPLTPDQSARRDTATSLRRALFPEGTGYLRLPYLQQWSRLDTLGKGLAANAQAIESLGLAREAARLRTWIELYGARLGITQPPTAAQTDPVAQAIQGWHEAWGKLLSAVLTEHDGEQEGDRLIRGLLRFYPEQAAEERSREQRARKKPETP
jgi:hypothetical protein